jgi:soluble P-type ATPase
MLREAVLGIAVIGPEGAAVSTVAAADSVCASIRDALRLLSTSTCSRRRCAPET